MYNTKRLKGVIMNHKTIVRKKITHLTTFLLTYQFAVIWSNPSANSNIFLTTFDSDQYFLSVFKYF